MVTRFCPLKLLSAGVAALVCLLVSAAAGTFAAPVRAERLFADSAAAAERTTGYEVAELHGDMNLYYVPEPGDKNFGQEWLDLHFVEIEDATVRPHATPSAGRPYMIVTGYVQSSYAPPNAGLSCSGVFSLRQGAPSPIVWSDVDVVLNAPFGGLYVRSSGPPGSNCDVTPNGGVGIGGDPFPAGPDELGFARRVTQTCGYPSGCKDLPPVTVHAPTNVSYLTADPQLSQPDPLFADNEDPLFYWMLDAVTQDLIDESQPLRSHGNGVILIPDPLWQHSKDFEVKVTVKYRDAVLVATGGASSPDGVVKAVPIALTSSGRNMLLRRTLSAPTPFTLSVSIIGPGGNRRQTSAVTVQF